MLRVKFIETQMTGPFLRLTVSGRKGKNKVEASKY